MTSHDDKIQSVLDLFRRLPPKHIERHISNIVDLVPDLMEDVLTLIDRPLVSRKCPMTSKDYLICDYNRDGDSFRSPWSNRYDPPLPDDGHGMVPSDTLRKLEIQLNEGFDTYRELYYQGGISSVYVWDLEDGFAVCVLIKKTTPTSGSIMKGSWDAIHVFDIKEQSRSNFMYRLTSTIMLDMDRISSSSASDQDSSHLNFNLSGNLSRHVEQEHVLDSRSGTSSHLIPIGQMVEDMELKIRMSLEQVYFGKTQEIINQHLHTSSSGNPNQRAQQKNLQQEVNNSLTSRMESKKSHEDTKDSTG